MMGSDLHLSKTSTANGDMPIAIEDGIKAQGSVNDDLSSSSYLSRGTSEAEVPRHVDKRNSVAHAPARTESTSSMYAKEDHDARQACEDLKAEIESFLQSVHSSSSGNDNSEKLDSVRYSELDVASFNKMREQFRKVE